MAFQGCNENHSGSNRGEEMNGLLLFAPISLGASMQNTNGRPQLTKFSRRPRFPSWTPARSKTANTQRTIEEGLEVLREKKRVSLVRAGVFVSLVSPLLSSNLTPPQSPPCNLTPYARDPNCPLCISISEKKPKHTSPPPYPPAFFPG